MITAPSNDATPKYVPPDPGGRSRYLVRALGIAILFLAVAAVLLMIVLHHQTSPGTPVQQPAKQSSAAKFQIHA